MARWQVRTLPGGPLAFAGAALTLSVPTDDADVVRLVEEAADNAGMVIERLPDLDLSVEAPEGYEPQGVRIGVVDEYGTIWKGAPGASERCGDLVARADEETADIYFDFIKAGIVTVSPA